MRFVRGGEYFKELIGYDSKNDMDTGTAALEVRIQRKRCRG